jgi:hypothetical protein
MPCAYAYAKIVVKIGGTRLQRAKAKPIQGDPCHVMSAWGTNTREVEERETKLSKADPFHVMSACGPHIEEVGQESEE